jgi:hypothetical protein
MNHGIRPRTERVDTLVGAQHAAPSIEERSE